MNQKKGNSENPTPEIQKKGLFSSRRGFLKGSSGIGVLFAGASAGLGTALFTHRNSHKGTASIPQVGRRGIVRR
jgi:hypothetical protein